MKRELKDHYYDLSLKNPPSNRDLPDEEGTERCCNPILRDIPRRVTEIFPMKRELKDNRGPP